jgi:hypothetical protein
MKPAPPVTSARGLLVATLATSETPVQEALPFRPGASCYGLCAWYAKDVLG